MSRRDDLIALRDAVAAGGFNHRTYPLMNLPEMSIESLERIQRASTTIAMLNTLIAKEESAQPDAETLAPLTDAEKVALRKIARDGDIRSAARLLLDADEYMPEKAKLAAMGVHLRRDGVARPVAVAEAWRAALRAMADKGDMP